MMRCEVCRSKLDMTAHSDWEGGLCHKCWQLTNPITRGWFALVQETAERDGWLERLWMEHNILWDILVAQAHLARMPPPPTKQVDPKRAKVDFSGVHRRR